MKETVDIHKILEVYADKSHTKEYKFELNGERYIVHWANWCQYDGPSDSIDYVTIDKVDGNCQ